MPRLLSRAQGGEIIGEHDRCRRCKQTRERSRAASLKTSKCSTIYSIASHRVRDAPWSSGRRRMSFRARRSTLTGWRPRSGAALCWSGLGRPHGGVEQQGRHAVASRSNGSIIRYRLDESTCASGWGVSPLMLTTSGKRIPEVPAGVPSGARKGRATCSRVDTGRYCVGGERVSASPERARAIAIHACVPKSRVRQLDQT